MSVFPIAILSLLMTLLSTPIVRRLGLQWGWVDQPGTRKLHQKPMVRVGGIAIACSTLATLFLVGVTAGDLLQSTLFQAILLGGVGFFAIGLSDDILNLHPVLRLILQAIVTTLVWSLGVQIEALPIPGIGCVELGWLSLPITFLWIAGIANAINWMDGMDGLATGISAIAAMTLAWLCWPGSAIPTLIALALFGSTLGFLRYNTHPAKLFMGDGGSYFIGFTLAAVSVLGWSQSRDFSTVLLPYFVLAVPIVDMVLVIASRWMEGKSPLFPDQRHLHHRLLQFGFSTPIVVKLIYGLVLCSCLSAVVLSHSPLGWIGITVTLALLVATYPAFWQLFQGTQSIPTVRRSR